MFLMYRVLKDFVIELIMNYINLFLFKVSRFFCMPVRKNIFQEN